MSTKVLMTAAEFAKTGLETDGFELVKGELVAMPPPKRDHGSVCLNVGIVLKTYSKTLGHGRVFSNDTGIVTDSNTVRGVDVAYIANPPWVRGEPDGYIDVAPDLAVEVRSEGQPWKELLAKMNEYIAMGARMVWIVDPSVRRLTVFEPDREPITYAAENQFDGGTVLPDLRFQVAEIFE